MFSSLSLAGRFVVDPAPLLIHVLWTDVLDAVTFSRYPLTASAVGLAADAAAEIRFSVAG